MRVVQATRFGGPEVLMARDAPEPSAEPGRLVIDVSVAEVLFLDTQLRSGWGSEYFSLQPPYIPGTGVAGVVSSVGDGVDPAWIGRSVVARTGDIGGYVQRAAIAAGEAFEVPIGLSLHEAVASLHDGPTALSRLEKADIAPGNQVLVNAAGGSLGVWLVSLAHAAGARVIATARGERKLELARKLGADAAVDYTEAGWARHVREHIGGAGFDVVFDGTGGEVGTVAFGITAPGGRFFSYGSASGEFANIDPDDAKARNVKVVGIDDRLAPGQQERLTRQALSEIEARRVVPVIGGTFPLERAADAHAAIEARGVIGKTLLLN